MSRRGLKPVEVLRQIAKKLAMKVGEKKRLRKQMGVYSYAHVKGQDV